jgi:pimeloyl-ACP methyl ester carboxylesterase
MMPRGQNRRPAVYRPRPARGWLARVDLSLVVLTRSIGATLAASRADYDVWLELRRAGNRSPRGEHVIAAHSSHNIQNDEPDLVAAAVRRVVAASMP